MSTDMELPPSHYQGTASTDKERIAKKRSKEREIDKLPESQLEEKIKKVHPQLKREHVQVERQPIHKQTSRKLVSQDLQGPEKHMAELGKKTLFTKDTEEAEYSDEFVISEETDDEAASSAESSISDDSEDTTSSEMRVSTSGESTSLESPAEADKTPPSTSRKGLKRSSSLQTPKLSRQTLSRSLTTPEERIETRMKVYQDCLQDSEKLDAKITKLKKEHDDSLGKLMFFMHNPTHEQDLNILIKNFKTTIMNIDEFKKYSQAFMHDDNIKTKIEALTIHQTEALENKLQMASKKISGSNQFKYTDPIQTTFTKLEHSIKNSPKENSSQAKTNKDIEAFKSSQMIKMVENFKFAQGKFDMLIKIQQTLANQLELMTNLPVLTSKLAKSSKTENVKVEVCRRFLQNEANSQNEFRRLSQKLISSHTLKQEVYNSYSDTILDEDISEVVQKLQTLQKNINDISEINRDSKTNPLKQNTEYQNLIAKYDSNREQLKLTKILYSFNQINQQENKKKFEAQFQSFVTKYQNELKEKYQLDLNQFLDKQKPISSQYKIILSAITNKLNELELKKFDLNSQLQSLEDKYYTSQQMDLITNSLNENEKMLFDFEVQTIKNENALAEFNAELYVQISKKMGTTDPRELEKLRADILHLQITSVFPHEKPVAIYTKAIKNVITNLK